jgi:hypothetical protein
VTAKPIEEAAAEVVTLVGGRNLNAVKESIS